MKKRYWLLLALLVLVTGGWFHKYGFDILTCGNSDKAVEEFLEDFNRQEIVVLKTAQKGPVKAVLFERTDFGDHCVALFRGRLFNLRWHHEGMNGYDADGFLCRTGVWTTSRFRGSICEVVVYGDNRGGQVGGYAMTDVPEVRREDLEADYILDIYVLDGIEHFEWEMEQFDRNGQILDTEW